LDHPNCHVCTNQSVCLNAAYKLRYMQRFQLTHLTCYPRTISQHNFFLRVINIKIKTVISTSLAPPLRTNRERNQDWIYPQVCTSRPFVHSDRGVSSCDILELSSSAEGCEVRGRTLSSIIRECSAKSASPKFWNDFMDVRNARAAAWLSERAIKTQPSQNKALIAFSSSSAA